MLILRGGNTRKPLPTLGFYLSDIEGLVGADPGMKHYSAIESSVPGAFGIE